MKRAFLVVAIAALSMVSAAAADLPAKAPPSWLGPIAKGYPYGSSGLFFGLYAEGGGGSVQGTVPGVGSASLTTTQGSAGLTVGYAWGWKNSPIAFSVEADFGATNFNGQNQGISLTGPLEFEQRFVAFTPLSNLMNLLPNFPSLGTVAPFNPLPAGISASNLQMGLFAGVREQDISANFSGVPANREWRVAPVIGIVSMEQLSNGAALRAYLKTVFPEKGVCAGPIPGACINEGQQVIGGASILW